jgi:outer membrane protein assembly factor BamB
LMLLIIMPSTLLVMADDWPQFQGPSRNSISKETGLLKVWPENGPTLAWTFSDAGLGYSSPAVVGNRLFITGAKGDEEELICLDTDKGVPVWKVPLGPKFDFKGNQWGAGPRATPSVAQGKVLALGGHGNLICVEAGSGKVVWQQHMMKDLGGEVDPIGGGPGTNPGEPKIGWGYSWSPLVDAERVICFPGGSQGSVAALELSTGKVLWRSSTFTQQASYASPIVAEIGGVRQYVVLHNGGLTSVDTQGSVLWNAEKTYGDVVIPTPILVDGGFYVSAGATPSTCDWIKVSKSESGFKSEETYEGRTIRVMKNTVGGSVVVNGFVYGYSDKIGWICQELSTGKQVWSAKQPLKAGSLVAVDGHLICYDEDQGLVGLIEINPKTFTLKSTFTIPATTKFQAPSGRNWTPPVIANGILYLRDQELLFAYQIK